MKITKGIQSVECMCTGTHGLFIPNRQVSFIVAGTLGLFFVTFVAGYFFAYQQQLIAFSSYAQKLADNQLSHDAFDTLAALDALSSTEVDEIPVVTAASSLPDPSPEQALSVDPVGNWYAQLIGFGTSSAAHRFAQKLQQKGIAVSVKTRYSKTPKGTEITWYQVITDPYTDRAALEQLVEQVSRTERLTGVRIVSC